MSYKAKHPSPTHYEVLTPLRTCCDICGQRLWVAYHNRRVITTLDGVCHLTLCIRRCWNRDCIRYHSPYRPEEEGGWALPHGTFGLDVIALVGTLRYTWHRSIPEIHQDLRNRGILIAQRTITNLLARYEELVALRLMDHAHLRERLLAQGRIILALDALQPDVGHEVLWVLRDCLSGEVLLARSLLGASEKDIAALLREGQQALPIPIQGVISDGPHAIRNAIRSTFPDVPHQLCHFHYLREAAKPVYEADRHAKKELKKSIRGVRPIERAVEQRKDPEAEIIRSYCLAVRSALTDDGRPPLSASGLKLFERLSLIAASFTRVAEKGGSRAN